MLEKSWDKVECPYKRFKITDTNRLKAWKIKSIPTTIMYDKNKEKVIKRYTGYMTPTELEDWLKE